MIVIGKFERVDPALAIRERYEREHPELLANWDELQLGGLEEMVIRRDRERQAAIDAAAKYVTGQAQV